MTQDPRYYQIVVLIFLLGFGLGTHKFNLSPEYLLTIVSASLFSQAVFVYCFQKTKTTVRQMLDCRSSLITALSLCLLLRTDFLWVAALASVLSIGSKFVLRWEGRHFFNPTNFGLVMTILLTQQAWISPGQWGSILWFAGFLACLGGFITFRARRYDVSLGFLGFYSAILFARALWLQDPMSIPVRQLQTGALLLFVFFMISDPKTTPNSRTGRLIFAFLTACLACYFQFSLYMPLGIIYALFGMSFLVPLLNKFFPETPYQWSATSR